MALNLIRRVRFHVILWAAVLLTLLVNPAVAGQFAAYVMDARTGLTLYSENADTRLNPASLTKMMTLYITFQEIEAGRISLDTMITVSKHAAAQPPSRLGLKAGQKIASRHAPSVGQHQPYSEDNPYCRTQLHSNSTLPQNEKPGSANAEPG